MDNPFELISKKIDFLTDEVMELKRQKIGSKDDDILDVVDAAKFLNVAKSTIYTLVSDGKLPHTKQGKRLYFTRKGLKAYIYRGKKFDPNQSPLRGLK